MIYIVIFGSVVALFGVMIWIGNRQTEFYGDKIKNKSNNLRDQANQKSTKHSHSSNDNNYTGGGEGPST